MNVRVLVLSAVMIIGVGRSFGQTSSLEGDVIGQDGSKITNCKNCIQIERTDIKGKYQCPIDKKGHYFHAGLPLGVYRISVVVDGKTLDVVDKVRTRLGDPTAINFDLHAMVAKQQATQRAMEAGKGLTKEQERGMSAEQKAAIEKAMKEREAGMKKNKELNDSFNSGMTALQGKQYDQAVQAFTKASELDAKQNVVWAQLAESYMGLGSTKTGAEQQVAYDKGLEAYGKAIELKVDDAAYHNNFALALAKAKKFPEAQAELTKAATLDPTNAGRYFYNLGALLVNSGQTEPAGEASKKAIAADPNYADAQYQYGVYLVSKAQVSADGKVTPVPGTIEAFQKYLELKPDGPFAESAKGMLTSMNATIDTSYKNPNAPASKKSKKK